MKKRLLLFAVFFVLFTAHAYAQGDGLGIGVVFGEPSGLSLKYWLDKNTAVDYGASWSLGSDEHFQIHMDYLIHRYDVIKIEKGITPIYYGIGGRIKFDKDSDEGLGVRIPLGIAYYIPNTPLDVFFEIAPIVDLIPKTSASLNVGIGVRYFFKGARGY